MSWMTDRGEWRRRLHSLGPPLFGVRGPGLTASRLTHWSGRGDDVTTGVGLYYYSETHGAGRPGQAVEVETRVDAFGGSEDRIVSYLLSADLRPPYAFPLTLVIDKTERSMSVDGR